MVRAAAAAKMRGTAIQVDGDRADERDVIRSPLGSLQNWKNMQRPVF
jgi:hypothetical protein